MAMGDGAIRRDFYRFGIGFPRHLLADDRQPWIPDIGQSAMEGAGALVAQKRILPAGLEIDAGRKALIRRIHFVDVDHVDQDLDFGRFAPNRGSFHFRFGLIGQHRGFDLFGRLGSRRFGGGTSPVSPPNQGGRPGAVIGRWLGPVEPHDQVEGSGGRR